MTELPSEASEGNNTVSCRLIGWAFDICREHDIDVGRLLVGMSYDEAYLRDRNNYIEWNSFCVLATNVTSLFSIDQLIEMSQRTFEYPIFRLYASISRLVFDPKSQYRWFATGLVPRLYPITVTVVEEGSQILHLKMTVNEPLAPCPTLFQIFEGQFIGMSTSMGCEKCDVQVTYLDRGAEYIIEFPDRRTLLGQIISLIKKPGDLYYSAIELRKSHDELISKSRELEWENDQLKQAQSRISGLEKQYKILENTIEDVLWIADKDDQFTYVSPAVKKVFGYEIEEVLSLTMIDLVSTSLSETEIEQIAQAHQTWKNSNNLLKPSIHEVLVERKDGSEFWADIHIAPIYSEEGMLTGFSGITRDISRRKNAEFEKQVLQSELSQSRHLESLGQLAGGIAHDFNNMLTTVLGFADLARSSLPEDNNVGTYLSEISGAAGRASDLVKQLLTFSKQQPMAPVPVNINEIISRINPMIRRLVAENIDISIDLKSVPNILGEVSELERVIVNLCINSSDAMPEGGLLKISSSEYLVGREDSRAVKTGVGSFACITVSDTGVGMTPDVRQKILEPFFSTKPFGEGTGLGLALTYSIVQQHNGFLDIVSQPNRGTTVKVFIPKTHLSVVDSHAEEVVPDDSHSGTVLVVEDQQQVRQLVVEILQSSGFNVKEARDGEEAVSTYKKEWKDIDLVLMDIVMPKMGGRDAMSLMREVNPEADVLFMTGYSGEDSRIGFANHSGHKILRKPFSSGDVVRRVSQIIES